MSKKRKEGQLKPTMIEDPDVIVDKAEVFFSNTRNKNITLILGGVIILAVVGFFLYSGQVDSKNKEANEEMFQAIYNYEADSLAKALNGDGFNYGFIQIINEYSGTEAANLANLYAGNIYMNLGDFPSALRHLKEFSSSDYVVQARAYSLIGDSHMELAEYAEAASYYEKAAEYKPNASYTPIYLQKLALASEKAGDYSGAAEAYGTIIEDYFSSALVQEAKKQKARLESLSQ